MDLAEIALELWTAHEAAALIEPPSHRHPGFSIADGYAVGELLHERRLASGAVPVGLKLGFTNQAAWESVGLDSPFWSPIYDSTVVQSRVVSLRGLVGTRIEPEIVLGFQAEVRLGAPAVEVSDAIGWVALAFEIVQCHYPDWVMAPADAIADSGVHALLVVGDHVSVSAAEALSLGAIEVELCREGVSVARGRGANALGGPIEAIGWLLRLPGVAPLRPGSIVTTGSLTTAMATTAGQTWRLSAEGPVTLGGLQLTLT